MSRCVSFLLFSVGALMLMAPVAGSQTISNVEVVVVRGLIDRSVEKTVRSVIETAEREEAALVVLHIDSEGVVGGGRARRMRKMITGADVPVVTWVGPAGASAANGAIVILQSGLAAAAPGASIGPLETIDFHRRLDLERVPDFVGVGAEDVPDRRLSVADARERHLVALVAPSLQELIEKIPVPVIDNFSESRTFDTSDARIRFHNLDLFGRLLHAAAQPSITYLLLLLALVGIVFELFHPSNGPAGVSGLAALALSVYGVATLGGSWLGFALIVVGVAAFAVDLRYQSLGLFTMGGFVGLVAGSILLFSGPWLRISPWVLAFGITSMVLFLLGAMTRVLRDLRAVARGEIEVQDAHPHPNGQGG